MTRKQQLGFIARIAPAAQASAKKRGVPASVTIAQAILESGWGKSQLAKAANNFFGIKDSKRFNEGYCEFKTKEFRGGKEEVETAGFEAFKSETSCFDAHARLLAELERYAPAMADADDPLVFAARLQECGYSTDPGYAKKLAALIAQFRLTQYDQAKEEKA